MHQVDRVEKETTNMLPDAMISSDGNTPSNWDDGYTPPAPPASSQGSDPWAGTAVGSALQPVAPSAPAPAPAPAPTYSAPAPAMPAPHSAPLPVPAQVTASAATSSYVTLAPVTAPAPAHAAPPPLEYVPPAQASTSTPAYVPAPAPSADLFGFGAESKPVQPASDGLDLFGFSPPKQQTPAPASAQPTSGQVPGSALSLDDLLGRF